MNDEFLIIGAGLLLTIVALAAWGIIYYIFYAVRSQILGETIWRGREDTNAVALTFDDGPSPDTEKLLDVLREKNVKATFFMIGKEVKKYPRIARRVAREGHEIGNHSYSHKIFLFCSRRRTDFEIYKTQEIISNLTGVAPRLIRPPCGARSRSYFKKARKFMLETVQWSDTGYDWKYQTPEKIADAVLKTVKAGSIILLHDGDGEQKNNRRATVEAIPLILNGLREKNLRVVSLETLCSKAEAENVPTKLINQTVNGEKCI